METNVMCVIGAGIFSAIATANIFVGISVILGLCSIIATLEKK